MHGVTSIDVDRERSLYDRSTALTLSTTKTMSAWHGVVYTGWSEKVRPN